MEAATRRRLAATFNDDARDYARSRPGYPLEAVSWLAGARPVDVLDLGAGTGSLTSPMVQLGHHVVAADPSPSMVAALRSGNDAVPAVQAAAEALPFAPESFDLVTVATAFHWFDAEPALATIASVLRSGGHLALVWNIRVDDTGSARRFGGLLRSVQPHALQGDWGTSSVTAVRESTDFAAPQYAEFGFTQQLDRAGLVALAASRSYVSSLAPARRRHVLDRVAALFDQEGRGTGRVELPYRTRCWRFPVVHSRSGPPSAVPWPPSVLTTASGDVRPAADGAAG